MIDITNPDRVRVQRQIVILNAAAAIVNCMVGIWIMSWMSLANFAAAAFSAYWTWKSWQRIPEVKREQEQRIIRILKGRV